MAQQKIEFIEGASKRGIDRKIAEKVFDQIETFGRYGFVKAHSTGYAIIAYRTAYLKTHFPQEFLAASLTSEMGDTSKILMFKKECKEMGIELLPPDINECFAHFSVSDGKIIYGLAAVKNVGVAAADSIVNARLEKGKFTDIFDFCSRVDTRLVNRKALESLVACGAFDSIHPIRSRVYDSIDIALNYGAQYQKDHKAGQSLLFGQLSSSAATLKPRLKEIPPGTISKNAIWKNVFWDFIYPPIRWKIIWSNITLSKTAPLTAWRICQTVKKSPWPGLSKILKSISAVTITNSP
jgi:DNA polymerase-3 subunit alpha